MRDFVLGLGYDRLEFHLGKIFPSHFVCWRVSDFQELFAIQVLHFVSNGKIFQFSDTRKGDKFKTRRASDFPSGGG